MPILITADTFCSYFTFALVEWLVYFQQSWRESLLCGPLSSLLATFPCSGSRFICALLGLLNVVLVIQIVLLEAPPFFWSAVLSRQCAEEHFLFDFPTFLTVVTSRFVG